MLDMLLMNIELPIKPKETISKMKEYSTKKLFFFGLCMSLFSMVSLFLSDVLKIMGNPYSILTQLVTYYSGLLLYFSLVFLLFIIFHKKGAVLKFIGIYLSTDSLFLLIWPLTMLSLVFPKSMFFVQFFSFFLLSFIYILKFRVFKIFFKTNFLQTLFLFLFPFVVVGIWFLAMFFNILFMLSWIKVLH